MTDRANASLVERLAKLWLAWFCVYLATGAFAMVQQRTGFFADTVDHVQWLWVQLIFLNLPLQIVMALTAIQLNKSSAPRTRQIANTIAVVNTVLIVVHIIISVGVRFTR